MKKIEFCSLTTRLKVWTATPRRALSSFMRNHAQIIQNQIDAELKSLPLTLEAYGADLWIIARERPSAAEIESSVERLLQTSGVRYIHIRNTEAGCFIARIERDHASHSKL